MPKIPVPIPVSAEVNTEEEWLGLRDLQVKLKHCKKATKFEKNLPPRKVGEFFKLHYFTPPLWRDLVKILTMKL